MAELHELENYGALEFTNLPSISPQSDFPGWRFLGLACKHANFHDSSVTWVPFSVKFFSTN